jgi:hypothetical protein
LKTIRIEHVGVAGRFEKFSGSFEYRFRCLSRDYAEITAMEIFPKRSLKNLKIFGCPKALLEMYYVEN